MRSPSAFERRVLIAGAVLTGLAASGVVRADDKQVCSDAYAATQTLRKDGKLQAAREQALLCVKDACAEFIRTDCATWLGEIDASQPTVVFDVRDRSGAPVLAGTIKLDGKSWLEAVDTQAHPIDPGTHAVVFTGETGATVEQTVVVREGEKNVKVTATLPVGAAPAEPLVPRASRADTTEAEASILPWVVGGAGVGTMAVGAVLGFVVIDQRSTFDEHCSAETKTCDQVGADARSSGETIGPISTVLLVTGAAAVGVGVVLLITDEPAEPTASAVRVHTGPVAGGGGASWQVGGRF